MSDRKYATHTEGNVRWLYYYTGITHYVRCLSSGGDTLLVYVLVVRAEMGPKEINNERRGQWYRNLMKIRDENNEIPTKEGVKI